MKTIADVQNRFGTSDALTLASCALSFFRNRNSGGRKMKKHRDANALAQNRRLCRAFVRAARIAGWRGSVVAEILRRAKEGKR